MKPSITPSRLYNNADVTVVANMTFIDGCEKLIHMLEDAKKVEVSKCMDEIDYNLITAQNNAQSYWRGIIAMIQKENK